MDSVRGYFGSEVDVLCLVKILSRRAQNQSRSDCFVIADMGSFYMIRMVNQLMKYEASMPLKFDTYENGLIKCKAFCTYNQKDFDSLTEDQKQLLFEHHYRNFIVSE
jgi:DNA-directed RNA polymerase specialized sigma subunit